MESKTILNSKQFELVVRRLSFELIEKHQDFSSSVIIGVQPRGIHLAKRLVKELEKSTGKTIAYGELDVTFFRDDFRHHPTPLEARSTDIRFEVEGKNVILVDDVLFTGRTIRSAFDALLAFGRPKQIELLVLINRRYMREMPIEANYIGKSVDTLPTQKIKVLWKEIQNENEDNVTLYNEK